MIDTAELHIVLLVVVTLTLIQGHRDARNQELLHQLSRNGAFGMLLRLNAQVNLIIMIFMWSDQY